MKTHTEVLNAAFVRLTGNTSKLDINRIFIWDKWRLQGDPPWNEKDLELVVRFIKRHMSNGKESFGYKPTSLSFRNLVWDWENFQDLIGPARAEARIKPATAKEEMLMATGRPTQQPATPKTAGDVLASARALADWRKWRVQNNL